MIIYIKKLNNLIYRINKGKFLMFQIFILILVILPNFLFSQKKSLSEVNISEYLYSNIILEQKIIDSYNDNIKYLKKTSFEIPFIKDIQIRTSSDELNYYYQQTSIRIIPKIFGTKQKDKQLFDSYAKYYNTEKEFVILNNLKNRYLNVIINIQNKNSFSLNKQLLKMYEELIEVKKVNINDFDILEDIIEIEEDITKTSLKNISIENSIQISNNNISSELYNNNILQNNDYEITFDDNKFITVNFIKKKLNKRFKENYKFNENNILFLKEQNLYDIELNRYNADKKRSEKNILSFVEFSYDNKYYYEEGKIDNAFSVGVGLSFSFLNNNDSFLKRKYINILNEKNNFETKKLEVSIDFSSNLENLKKKVDQYIYLSNRVNNGYAQFTLDTYTNNDQIDPAMLLEAKITVFKNKILLNELKQDILNDYIEILYISGLMNENLIELISKKSDNFLEISN